MPAVSFKCQAGVIPIKDCLQACPVPEGRCLSLPTLLEVGYHREYTSKFSTTLLLMPTRQAYLSLTKEYAINPKERAFMLLGTKCHRRLQIVGQKLDELKVEFPVNDMEVSSCLDLLEPLPDGTYRLVDYKTIGTYSIKKMLQSPPDFGTYAWQINHYRLQVSKWFNVSESFIQYIARDFTPRSRIEGVDMMGLIKVPHYPDNEVAHFFDYQREALQMALAQDRLPPICPDRWNNDGRCQSYCDVNSVCEHGMKYIEAKAKREAQNG